MGSCDYLPATFKKRVTVHNVTRASDGQGGFTETWQPDAGVSCSIEPVKAYEKFQAMQTATPVSHKLVMRYTPHVTSNSRLVYGTRVFAVKEVLNRNEERRYLDVRAIELRTVPYVPNAADALLTEGGGYLLLEDGSKLLRRGRMTDRKISQLPDGGAPRTTDAFPVARDGNNVQVALGSAAALTPLLTTDAVLVIRAGVVSLATVTDLLAAQTPAGPGGFYDFSDPSNSAYAATL